MRRAGLCAALLVLVVVFPGCARSASERDPRSEEVTGTPKGHGVVFEVKLTPEMAADKPERPDLSNPRSAVRSYLDWVSYAYRIGDSDVAIPVMGAEEEVHINSYVQYNLQEHSRLIDQHLDSIEFKPPITRDETTTLLPAFEKWTYRWVSAREAGKVVGGPFRASYETTYTVARSPDGNWVVQAVEARKLDAVK